jgi:photosystem II stability/assembly factor-like uncharacterized protein
MQMQRQKRSTTLAAASGLGLLSLCLYPALARASAWPSIGPYGGDARSLTAEPGNPRHLYLGTTASWIYDSVDGGSSWRRLSKLGNGDDLAVDNIVVDEHDPKTIVAAVWKVDERGGGIYISHDSGQHWTSSPSMAGQSVRALAQAPSDSKVFVAGTLSGVYRTEDGGEHWSEISPQGSTEIHEVESVAIDPFDVNTIYAGTWHLPWKTTDGGQHWANVKEGLIDDSDVFSIIIDPGAPSVVYASACSGIYKSLNGGELFHKVQGIPSTARRTRVLMQDPVARNIIYAGTTEGLYKTADSGAAWVRLTGPDVIINDVFVDPANDQHLLLATDRSGVLESEDGGQTFQGSNTGFSQRQVESVLLDRKAPATIYAGVLNDKIYGGVFVSEDGGTRWQQRSDGLEGRDVFALAQADDGTVLAGTGHGIFRWDGSRWQQDGDLVKVGEQQVRVRRGRAAKSAKSAKFIKPASEPPFLEAAKPAEAPPVATAAPSKPAPTTDWTPVFNPVGKGPKSPRPPAKAAPKFKTPARPRQPAYQTVTHETRTPGGQIDSRVNQLSLGGPTWYAATSTGLYRSADQGQSWQGPINGATDTLFVNAHDQVVVAASQSSLMLSSNDGQTWSQMAMPGKLSGIRALVVAANHSVWVGGREGLFYTEDAGQSWKPLANLPLGEISGLTYDPDLKRVLVTSRSSTLIFGVDGTDTRWKWWDAGWPVHEVYSKNGRLVGASFYDGVVVEPEPTPGKPVTPAGGAQ